jgi:UPF0716 protein FxsA
VGWIALAIIVVPFIELAVLLAVGSQIGVLWTIVLLVLVSIVGSYLVKREGWAAWQRLTERTARGEVPGRELVDGGLILFAGALLLTPGFLTDVFAVILLFPPTRAPFRVWALRKLERRARRYISGGPDGPGSYSGYIDV